MQDKNQNGWSWFIGCSYILAASVSGILLFVQPWKYDNKLLGLVGFVGPILAVGVLGEALVRVLKKRRQPSETASGFAMNCSYRASTAAALPPNNGDVAY